LNEIIDELQCRVVSVIDWVLGKDYLILDNQNNRYIKGKKYTAHKIENHSFTEEEGWVKELSVPNGPTFYRKKGG